MPRSAATSDTGFPISRSWTACALNSSVYLFLVFMVRVWELLNGWSRNLPHLNPEFLLKTRFFLACSDSQHKLCAVVEEKRVLDRRTFAKSVMGVEFSFSALVLSVVAPSWDVASGCSSFSGPTALSGCWKESIWYDDCNEFSCKPVYDSKGTQAIPTVCEIFREVEDEGGTFWDNC